MVFMVGVAQGIKKAVSPLILYSPVSWLLLLLRMLRPEDAFDPTVSTRSNPGCATSTALPVADWEPSLALSLRLVGTPGRRAKGFRIGIVGYGCWKAATTARIAGAKRNEKTK